jgi:hypothetical protein
LCPTSWCQRILNHIYIYIYIFTPKIIICFYFFSKHNYFFKIQYVFGFFIKTKYTFFIYPLLPKIIKEKRKKKSNIVQISKPNYGWRLEKGQTGSELELCNNNNNNNNKLSFPLSLYKHRERQTIFLSPNSSIEKVQSYPSNIVKRFSVNPFVFVFPLSWK